MKKILLNLVIISSIVSCITSRLSPEQEFITTIYDILQHFEKYDSEEKLQIVNKKIRGLIGQILKHADTPNQCNDTLYALSQISNKLLESHTIPNEQDFKDTETLILQICKTH